MTDPMITQAWFFRLKAANRDLIKFNGGIERSATISSISKSQIGRCNNAQDTELLPIPAVIRLEAECGVPVVTSAMADLNGRRLNDPESDDASSGCIMAAKAELDIRQAELSAMTARAAADGKLTPAEIHQLNSGAASVSKAVATLQSLLAGALPKGGVSTAFRVVGEN